MWRSVPQMAALVIRTMASSGDWISGLGTSRTAISKGLPSHTTARMVFLSWPLVWPLSCPLVVDDMAGGTGNLWFWFVCNGLVWENTQMIML